MAGDDYTWDRRKAAANLRRHRLSFEAALGAFEDEYGLLLPDEAHSDEEERTILIGRIGGDLIVTVVFTRVGETVRIISARPASARERREYHDDEEG
jgi:uncharacterized DUF497 family protein